MKGYICMIVYRYSVELLFIVVTFDKVAANTELANTDPLILVETEG